MRRSLSSATAAPLSSPLQRRCMPLDVLSSSGGNSGCLMRKFTGIDFMTEAVPDETTLCKLFFDAINRVMVQTGHMMKGGTIVDATIINAPSSTKNAEKKRDPEMHQTKRGRSANRDMGSTASPLSQEASPCALCQPADKW